MLSKIVLSMAIQSSRQVQNHLACVLAHENKITKTDFRLILNQSRDNKAHVCLREMSK